MGTPKSVLNARHAEIEEKTGNATPVEHETTPTTSEAVKTATTESEVMGERSKPSLQELDTSRSSQETASVTMNDGTVFGFKDASKLEDYKSTQPQNNDSGFSDLTAATIVAKHGEEDPSKPDPSLRVTQEVPDKETQVDKEVSKAEPVPEIKQQKDGDVGFEERQGARTPIEAKVDSTEPSTTASSYEEALLKAASHADAKLKEVEVERQDEGHKGVNVTEVPSEKTTGTPPPAPPPASASGDDKPDSSSFGAASKTAVQEPVQPDPLVAPKIAKEIESAVNKVEAPLREFAEQPKGSVDSPTQPVAQNVTTTDSPAPKVEATPEQSPAQTVATQNTQPAAETRVQQTHSQAASEPSRQVEAGGKVVDQAPIEGPVQKGSESVMKQPDEPSRTVQPSTQAMTKENIPELTGQAKSVEPVIKQIEEHVRPAATAIAAQQVAEQNAQRTLEAVRQNVQEAVHKNEVPVPKEIREVIKTAETDRQASAPAQIKSQADQITEKVVAQVREDLKALAVTTGSSSDGNKAIERLPERPIDRPIDKIQDKGQEKTVQAVQGEKQLEKLTPEQNAQKLIREIKDDLKASSVARGNDGGEGVKRSEKTEQTIQRIIDKIEKELQGAATGKNSGDNAVKALEAIKDIVSKNETLSAKQLKEIIKAIEGEKPQTAQPVKPEKMVSAPAEIQKNIVDVEKALRIQANKSSDPVIQKMIDKIERELNTLQGTRGANEATVKATERIKEVVAKLDTPLTAEQLQKVLKAIEGEKPGAPLANAKQIEEYTKPPMTKQEAMQAVLGLLVDAERLSNGLVREIKVDTENKIGQIQANVDELLKIRIEQFIALSAHQEKGVSHEDFKQVMQETIQELATRYGLSEEQKMLLQRVMVALSNGDFEKKPQESADTKNVNPAEEKLKQEMLKLKEQLKLREAKPEDIEKVRLEEFKKLEEMLKEREEIKQLRAENKIKELMKEELDPETKYMIDEFLEVIKVFVIKGRVLIEHSKKPLQAIAIVGGLLGERKTDNQGYFQFNNVPEGTLFMIGPDSNKYTFSPVYVTDTLTASAYLEFRARPIREQQEGASYKLKRKVPHLSGNKNQLRQSKRNVR